MKKLLAVLLCAFLMLAVFAGCGNSDGGSQDAGNEGDGGESTGDTLYDQVMASGKLTVGTSADYPPYEFVEDGEFVGFEMDLIRELGTRMGLEVEIVDMGFDTLIAALKQAKINCVIASMNAEPDRLEQVDFSDAYHTDQQGVLIKTGTDVVVNDRKDLANYTVGVQSGTIHEGFLMGLVEEGLMEESQIYRFEKTDMGILDLASGRIDIYFTELLIAKMALTTNEGIEITYSFNQNDENDFATGLRIAVPKDEPELLNAINETLNGMLDDGTVEALAEQWLAGFED